MQLFVNDLTVIDFSYLCANRGLIGESWIVDLTLIGSLDEQNMVLDFAEVKKKVKGLIDELVDHKLAVPTKAEQTRVETMEDGVLVEFSSKAGGPLAVYSPADAFALIDVETIDVGSVAEYLNSKILELLPNNVEKVIVQLRPENIDGFYYHYTHGLKKHDGNCQRIAHGHRSKIIVFENGMKCPRLQKYWSDRFQDIYLASEEDRIDVSELKYITPADGDKPMLAFSYQASQGYFELWLAADVTEVVPCDTTVECLAQYMNSELKRLEPDNSYRVTAFEGVAKGAIV